MLVFFWKSGPHSSFSPDFKIFVYQLSKVSIVEYKYIVFILFNFFRMKYVQFKLPVNVEHETWAFPGKGWKITKHNFHVTLFEIKVNPDILEEVIAYVYANIHRLEENLMRIQFSRWHIFQKEKQHFAVLTPDDSAFIDVDLDTLEKGNEMIFQRKEWLLTLFQHFGCNVDQVEPENVEGFPIWSYKTSNGTLQFTCSRYNRPNVWFPHVTIAVKFTKVPEKYDLNQWQIATGRIQLRLFHEVLIDKV
jgi:hypothetical protein